MNPIFVPIAEIRLPNFKIYKYKHLFTYHSYKSTLGIINKKLETDHITSLKHHRSYFVRGCFPYFIHLDFHRIHSCDFLRKPGVLSMLSLFCFYHADISPAAIFSNMPVSLRIRKVPHLQFAFICFEAVGGRKSYDKSTYSSPFQ